MLTQYPPLTILRIRWSLILMIYGVAVFVGYGLIQSSWQQTFARHWVIWATLSVICQLGILWWGLKHNRRHNEAVLLPTLGYGNTLTLLRGLGLCFMAGFLFAPRPPGFLAWAPPLLYAASCLIDYLDGYVARLTGHTTVLGEILDMEFDGIGMLIVIVLGIQYGQLPIWYLILGLGRQLFIFGIWLRQRQNLPVYEMTESHYRRIIAGFQMGFMSVILWPVFMPPTTTLASILFAIPLAGSFLRDWFVVSGQIDPRTARYQYWRKIMKKILEGWLPLLCRLVAGGVVLFLLSQEFPSFTAWQTYLRQAEPIYFAWLLTILAILSPLAMGLFLLGILGRINAIVMIGLASLDIFATKFDPWTNGLLLACAIWVLQLGSGYWALWAFEESWLRRRVGE
ncbi:CDP-alcohol phosphatidyltransferase family protein [Chloroflexi bacterium TSY]|nr:CDP-alcohol phosphatidyltransferase family protein [Chloroflexi bacterium TSY]